MYFQAEWKTVVPDQMALSVNKQVDLDLNCFQSRENLIMRMMTESGRNSSCQSQSSADDVKFWQLYLGLLTYLNF